MVEHIVQQGIEPCQSACPSPVSGPLFFELFFRCSFHLPSRPTSPFDLRCRQVLIGERFSLVFRYAKPDGASRTSVHLNLPTWIKFVVQAELRVVVFDTEPN